MLINYNQVSVALRKHKSFWFDKLISNGNT